MLSGKLIHLIEAHEEEITERIIREIQDHVDLAHLRKLPVAELREPCRKILQNLGHWLAWGNEGELAREYEEIGKSHFVEAVPLQESVHGLTLVKQKMFDFIDDQGMEPDALTLYAEEELERRVGRFFDLLLIHLVRGYEAFWRHAAHAVA